MVCVSALSAYPQLWLGTGRPRLLCLFHCQSTDGLSLAREETGSLVSVAHVETDSPVSQGYCSSDNLRMFELERALS